MSKCIVLVCSLACLISACATSRDDEFRSTYGAKSLVRIEAFRENTELARIIHEHADQTPRTTGTAGLLVPAGTLQILASSTTLQGRLR
ncbi:MAG: hypothetical protein ACI8TQ_003520, partial [Planctomycetota bacterium]